MNNLLEYKGYYASIRLDSDENIFVGEVLGINDSLNFHGSSIKEINRAFHDCIDNYLELCKKIGKKPEKEYSGHFSVRISPELHKKIYVAAEAKGLSLNKALEDAIMQYC